MDPSLELAFDEFFEKLFRRFDAFEAKWLNSSGAESVRPERDAEADRRVAAREDIAEIRAVRGQSKAEGLRVGAPKVIYAEVVADDWGGLFEPVLLLEEQDEPMRGQLALGVHIEADHWGGEFEEPVGVAEERDDEPAASDAASPPPVMELLTLDTAATEEMELKVYPLQIQEELEKPFPCTPASGKVVSVASTTDVVFAGLTSTGQIHINSGLTSTNSVSSVCFTPTPFVSTAFALQEFEPLGINGVQISSADKLVAPFSGSAGKVDASVVFSEEHEKRVLVGDPSALRPPPLRLPWRLPPRPPRPRRPRRAPPRPHRLRRPRRASPHRRGRPPWFLVRVRGRRPRLRGRAGAPHHHAVPQQARITSSSAVERSFEVGNFDLLHEPYWEGYNVLMPEATRLLCVGHHTPRRHAAALSEAEPALFTPAVPRPRPPTQLHFPDLVDIEFIGSNSVQLAALGNIKELTLSVLLLGAQLNYAPATPVDPGDPPPTLLTRCSTPGGNHVAFFPEEVPFVHMCIAPSCAVTSSKTSWQQDFAKQFTTGNLVTFTKLVMALDALLLQLRMFVELRSYFSVQESQPEHFSEEMKHVEAICKKHAEAIISDFRFPFLGIQFLIRSLVAHVGTNIAHGFKIIVVVFLSDGHQVQSHKFSFGSDHDSAAMHAISEFPRGTFTVVDVECSIQDGSAHCICGLRSVAVKEMQLGTEYHGMLLTFIKSDGCTCQVAGNGLWVHSVDSDYGPSVVPSSRVPLAWDPGGMEQIIYSWSLFFEWYLAISRELISSNQWTCKCSAIFLELPWLFCRDGFFSVSNVSNEQTGLLVTSYMLTSRCFELQPWPSPAMERHDKEKEIASGFTVFLYLSHTSTYSTMATTHIISVDWKIQKRMSSTHVCCHDGLLFIIRELQVPWDPGGSAMSPLAWGQAAIQEGGNARYYFILRCRIMLLALLHAYYIKLN